MKRLQHRFIECEPDVTRLRATSEDSFVVMASDGLWDVISDQEAVVVNLDLPDVEADPEQVQWVDDIHPPR